MSEPVKMDDYGLIDESGVPIYCVNDPCESQALSYRGRVGGEPIALCLTCGQAYDLADGSPKRVWVVVAEYGGIVDDALAFATEDEAEAQAQTLRAQDLFNEQEDSISVWDVLVGLQSQQDDEVLICPNGAKVPLDTL